MNKMSGNQSDFAFIREDASRIVIGYDCKKITGKSLYEWYEIYLPKRQTSQLTLDLVKESIIADIDAQTDDTILHGFSWTILHGESQGETVNTWLSAENQRNYSEGQRVALMTNGQNLPLTYKIGETADKVAVYDTFETVQEITTFYLMGAQFIDNCLKAGWQRKDSIDWQPYEQALNDLNPNA